MSISIRSIASFLPEKSLTNDELSEILDTNDAWIYPRTGIHSRHIAADGENVSDMGAKAAEKAILNAGIDRNDIGGIIQTSTSPECLFPATATLIQHKLGLRRDIFAFDLQAACAGLVYALETARCFLKGNPDMRYLLVTAAEKMSAVVDWTNRESCILFGDGAAAILLENNPDDNAPDALSPAFLGTDGKYFDSLLIPAGGSRETATEDSIKKRRNYLHMDGRLIFKMAVAGMTECSRKVFEKENLPVEQIDWFVPHQANVRIIIATAERLGINPDKVFRNVECNGNTCSATIGIALDEMNRRGLLKSGQKILLASVGAGISEGAMLLRWR